MKSQLLRLLLITACTGHSSGERSSATKKSSTPRRRNLVESIDTYIPRSEVTDAAAVDLDVHAIKKELGKQNDEGWTNAMAIYRQGAFSKPIATLTLSKPLQDSISSGTRVTGMAMDGSDIVGKTVGKTAANDTNIRIAYDNDIMETGHTHCSVGGNPSPIIDGCLQSEGNVTIGNDETFHYTYNISESNHNDRTLIDLSKRAESRMWSCSHCPFEDFEKYYNYYGKFDYADRIIQYAFRGQEMELDHGNMDFGYYSKYGMKEFIYKGISYLSIWMYTIRQLEQAVADCQKGEFLQAVHFWDEAVAMYTGSRGAQQQDGNDNNNHGDLMLHQADLRCQEFSTCGEWSDSRTGKSYVNWHVFAHFADGQYNLLHNRCEHARQSKQEIVRLMTIPLIQATLRYAHIIAHETYFNEKHGAQASLYALSILPLVHDCSPQDADIVYSQLKSKNTANVDFGAVQKALENTYSCLNIQCSEIGGIWDETIGDYKYDAHPCGAAQEASNFLDAILGGTIGGLVFLTAVGLWTWWRGKLKEEEEGQDAAGANNDYWQDHHGQEEGFRDEPQYSGTRKMKTSQKLQDMLKHVGGSGLQQQQEEEHEEERTADCWQDDEDEECLFPDDEPNHFSDNPKRTDRKISNSYEI